MANFLPHEFRAELEALQDQVPPRPYAEIAETLESELGQRMNQLRSLDREPIASASLGQVHVAELVDGQRVCVKVQHRDIDRIVRLDLKTIRRIMQIVQFFVPVRGLDAYYHQIRELLTQELDFALEADNIERIAKNFTEDARRRLPPPRSRAVHRARPDDDLRRRASRSATSPGSTRSASTRRTSPGASSASTAR